LCGNDVRRYLPSVLISNVLTEEEALPSRAMFDPLSQLMKSLRRVDEERSDDLAWLDAKAIESAGSKFQVGKPRELAKVN